jgi:hypothetical protein
MTAGLTMADEAKRTQATAKPEYTTFRIYVKDGEDISELADKRNKTIAQLYHELFAKQVIELLLAETKKRTKDLENRRS